jgi:ElaB/YqjD/DUF883 family membrane-anchored ribosome-binding protein
MRNGEIKTVERAASAITDRIADTVRYATQCSTEARRLTSKAQDALQDGLYETTRALKGMKRRAEKFEGDAERYIKREPLKAVAVIAGVALFVGLVIGWKTRRRPRRIFGAVV